MKAKDSYWMLAETALPLASDINDKGKFEIYFKHGLLFNARLMMSDSQVINCLNLRALLQEKPEFGQFMDKDLLTVAVRSDNGRVPTLPGLRDSFIAQRKIIDNLSFYREDKDLTTIMQKANLVTYGIGDLADNYTEKSMAIFAGQAATRAFGVDDASVLHELIARQVEEQGILERKFIYYELMDKLHQLGKDGIWSKHETALKQMADAPYVTGIPTVMDTRPIYSPAHEDVFALVGNKKSAKTAEQTGGTISLARIADYSAYEEAMKLLSIDDILLLRDTAEFKEYQRFVGGGVENPDNNGKAAQALSAYQEKINNHLIAKVLGKKVGRQSFVERHIKPIKVLNDDGLPIYAIVVEGIAMGAAKIAADMVFPGMSVVTYFAGKAIGKVGQHSDADKTEGTRKLDALIDANKEKIEAKSVVDAGENGEVFYSSVNIE